MDGESPGLIFTVVSFLIGLSVLVFIHEMGHYSVARFFGMRVDRFSIGFGPEMVGWTAKTGTRWCVCALPLGGYVKFFGDSSSISNADTEKLSTMSDEDKSVCFQYRPLYQRAAVVFAGPAINLIVAVLVFAVLYAFNGVSMTPPKVGGLLEDGPAASSGLQAGDDIRAIDGRSVDRFSDLAADIRLRPNQTVTLSVQRGPDRLDIPVTLGARYQEDRFGNRYAYGYLGAQSTAPIRVDLGVFGALYEGTRQTANIISSIFTTLGQTIIGLRSIEEIGGPIRIAAMVGEAAQVGFLQFVIFLALISINLGVLNLMPIPALDGGHLFFYAIEAVKGSPLHEKAQELGYMAGAALMIMLMVFVTLNDLQSLAH